MDELAQVDIEKEIERRVAEQLRLRLEAAAAASPLPNSPDANAPPETLPISESDEDSCYSEDGDLEKVYHPAISVPCVGEGNLFCGSADGDFGASLPPQRKSRWEEEFDAVAGVSNGVVVGSSETFTIASFATQREDGRCVGPANQKSKTAPETFADVQLGFYSARQLIVLPEEAEVPVYEIGDAPTERSLTCIDNRFEAEAAEVIEKAQLEVNREESSDSSSDDATPSTNEDEEEPAKPTSEANALQEVLEYSGDHTAPERLISMVRESVDLDDPFALGFKASRDDMPQFKVSERCPYTYEALMAADGQANKKAPFQKPVSAVSLFNNGTALKVDVTEVSGALQQYYGGACDALHVCIAVYSLSTAEKKAPATKLSDDFWMLTGDLETSKPGADFNNLKSFVVFIPEEYRRTPLVLLCRVLRSVGGGNSTIPKPAANSNVSALDYSNNYYITSQNSLDMSNFDNVVDFYQRPHKYASHFENNTSKGEPLNILKQENQQLAMMVGQLRQELGWCVFELNSCLSGKAPNYATLNTGALECYGLYRGCPSNPTPYAASSSLPIQLDSKQVVDFILNQYIPSPMKQGKAPTAGGKPVPEVTSVQVSTTATSHGLKLIPISIALKVTDVTPFNVVGSKGTSGIQYDITFPTAGLPEETECLAVVREEPSFTKSSTGAKAKEQAQSKTELCRFCPSPLLILNSGYFNAYHNVYYVRLSSLTLSKFFTFQPAPAKAGGGPPTKKKLPASHTTFAVQVSLKESDEGDFSDPEGLPVVYGRTHSETFFETSAFSSALSGAGNLLDAPLAKNGEEPKVYFSQDEIKLQLPPRLTPQHHLFFTFYAVDTTTATSAMISAKKAPLDAPSGPIPRFIKVGFSVLPLLGDSKANHALYAKDTTSLPLILPENATAIGANYLSKLAVSKSRFEAATSETEVGKNGEVTSQGGVPSVFAANGAPCIHLSAIPRSTVFATSSNLSATLNSMQTTLPLISKHITSETSSKGPRKAPLLSSLNHDSIFIDQLRGIGSNLSLPEVLAYYPALSSYHMAIIGCTSNGVGSEGVVSLAVRKIALRTLLKVVQMVHQYDSTTRIQFRRVGHQQSAFVSQGKVVTTTVVNTLYTFFSNDALFTDGKLMFPIAQGLAEVWLAELEELEKAGKANPNPTNPADKDRELHRQRLTDFSWFLLDCILRSVYHTAETFARKNAESTTPTSALRQECFAPEFYALISKLLVAAVKATSPVARVQVVQRTGTFLRHLFVLATPKRVRVKDGGTAAVGIGLDRGSVVGCMDAVLSFLVSECGYSLGDVTDLTTLEKGANAPASGSAAGCLQVQSFVRNTLNSIDAYLLFMPVPSNHFPALIVRALLPHILHSGSLDVRSGALRLLNDIVGSLIRSAKRFGTLEGDVGGASVFQANLRAAIVGTRGACGVDTFCANTFYGGMLIFLCRNWKEVVASTTPPKTSSASKRTLIGTVADRRQVAMLAVWTIFTGGLSALRSFVGSLARGKYQRGPGDIFFISESEAVRKHMFANLLQMLGDAQSCFRHAHFSAQKSYYTVAVSRQRALAGVATGNVMLRRKRGAGESDVQGEDEKLRAMMNATPYTSPRLEASGKGKKQTTIEANLIPLFDSTLSTVVTCVGAVVSTVGLCDGSGWLQFGLSGFVSDPSLVSSEGGSPFTYPYFILLESLVSILNNSVSITVGAAALHFAAIKLLPHLISKRATYFPGVLLLLSRLLSFAVCAVDNVSPSGAAVARTNLVDALYKSQLRRGTSSTTTAKIAMHRGGVARLIASRALAEVVRRYVRLVGNGRVTEEDCVEYLTKLQPPLSTAFVTVAESRGRNLKVASVLVESGLVDVVTILRYLEVGSGSSSVSSEYWAKYSEGYQTAIVAAPSTATKAAAVRGNGLLVVDESGDSQEKHVLPMPLSVIRASAVVQDSMLQVAKSKEETVDQEVAASSDDDVSSNTATKMAPDGLFNHHVDPLELTPVSDKPPRFEEANTATIPSLPDDFQESIPSVLGLFRAVLRLQYDDVLQVSSGSDKKAPGALLQQIHKGVAYWGVISAFLGGKDSDEGSHHESQRLQWVEEPNTHDANSPYTSVRQISLVSPGNKQVGGSAVGSVTCASLLQAFKWLQKLYELHLAMSASTDTNGNGNAEAAVTILAAASVAFKLVECFYDTVEAQQHLAGGASGEKRLPVISLPIAFLPPAILSHVFWHDFVRILPDLQAAENASPLLPVLRSMGVDGSRKTPLHLFVERELQGIWSGQQDGGIVSASGNPLLSMLFSGCAPGKSGTFSFTSSLFTTLGQQHAVSTAADLFLAAADSKGKKDENASLYRKTAIQALLLAASIAAARRDHASAAAFHQKLAKLYGTIDRPLSSSDHSKQHRFYVVFARMSMDPVPSTASLRVLFKVFLQNVYVKRRLKKLVSSSSGPAISEEEAKGIVEAEVEEFTFGLVEEYLACAERLQSKYLPSPGLLKVFKVPAEIERSRLEKEVAIPLVTAKAPSLPPPNLDPATATPPPSSPSGIVVMNDNLDTSSSFPLDDLAAHFYYAYLNHLAGATGSKNNRRSKAPVIPEAILNSDNFVGAGGGAELESLLRSLHNGLKEESSPHQGGYLVSESSMAMSSSSMSFTASGTAGSKKRRNKEVLYRLIKGAGRVFQTKMENVCNLTVCEVFPSDNSDEDSNGFIGSFKCQLHVGLDKIQRPSSRVNKGSSVALAKASTVVDPQDQRLEDRTIFVSRAFPTTTTTGDVVSMEVRETDCMGTAITIVGREITKVKTALIDMQQAGKTSGSPARDPVASLLQKLHTSLLSPMSVSPPGEYYKQVMYRLVRPGAIHGVPAAAVAEVKSICEAYVAEVKRAMDEVLTMDAAPSHAGPSVMEKAPEVCAQVFKAIADMEVALLSVS